MAVIRWEPARELQAIQQEMNRLFGSAYPQCNGANGGTTSRWIPPHGCRRRRGALCRARRPAGVEETDVNVELEDNVLTISGERKSHAEERTDGYHRIERADVQDLALAHAAGRHRPGGHQGELQQRGSRGANPQARAAQAEEGCDQRRRQPLRARGLACKHQASIREASWHTVARPAGSHSAARSAVPRRRHAGDHVERSAGRRARRRSPLLMRRRASQGLFKRLAGAITHAGRPRSPHRTARPPGQTHTASSSRSRSIRALPPRPLSGGQAGVHSPSRAACS